MKKVFIFLIQKYKKYISPHLGDNCRFKPTCSEYAMEAIEVHGSLKGIIISSWRILRCNPFGKVGYDPVPKKGYWKNPEKDTWREGKNKE